MATKGLSSVEGLISAAFKRTKERFLSYFLASLVMFLLIAVSIVITVILVVAISLIARGIGGPISTILTGAAILVLPITLLFVTAWSTLATVSTVVSPKKLGVIEAYKTTRPLAPTFMVIEFLTLLFIIGLVPVSILLIGIPLFLWYVWGSFMVFVYLDQKKTGLENLWISKEIISQNFWGVLGRQALLFIAIMFFSFMFMSSKSATLVVLWQLVNALFIGPFSVAYTYEMYTQLGKKDSAQTPTIWLIVSVVGFVLIVLGAFAAINTARTVVPQLMQQRLNKQFEQRFEQEYRDQMYDQMQDQIQKNDTMGPGEMNFQ